MMTHSLDLNYVTGEEIHAGDRVSFGGHPALIMAVIARGEYMPPFIADDWADYRCGFLLRTDDGQLYMYDYADEDIRFLSRTVPSAYTEARKK